MGLRRNACHSSIVFETPVCGSVYSLLGSEQSIPERLSPTVDPPPLGTEHQSWFAQKPGVRGQIVAAAVPDRPTVPIATAPAANAPV
ncbi:hypothetical protein ACFQL1_22425 [Halomicroarcula sp. GCM10025709]